MEGIITGENTTLSISPEIPEDHSGGTLSAESDTCEEEKMMKLTPCMAQTSKEGKETFDGMDSSHSNTSNAVAKNLGISCNSRKSKIPKYNSYSSLAKRYKKRAITKKKKINIKKPLNGITCHTLQQSSDEIFPGILHPMRNLCDLQLPYSSNSNVHRQQLNINVFNCIKNIEMNSMPNGHQLSLLGLPKKTKPFFKLPDALEFNVLELMDKRITSDFTNSHNSEEELEDLLRKPMNGMEHWTAFVESLETATAEDKQVTIELLKTWLSYGKAGHFI